MADSDDPAEAAARLEAALERIARLAERRTPPELVARVDALIAQLRRALGRSED